MVKLGHGVINLKNLPWSWFKEKEVRTWLIGAVVVLLLATVAFWWTTRSVAPTKFEPEKWEEPILRLPDREQPLAAVNAGLPSGELITAGPASPAKAGESAPETNPAKTETVKGAPSPGAGKSPAPTGNAGTSPPAGAENAQPALNAATTPEKPSWPLQGNVIGTFGWSFSPTYEDWRFHPGLDIAGKNDAAVAAFLSGKVIRVERSVEEGYRITIEHAGGLFSVYAHCGEVQVKPGQLVKAGQVIGRLGEPGFLEVKEGFHLHFELRDEKGQAIDPETYLKR